jgi:hypothetical protein
MVAKAAEWLKSGRKPPTRTISPASLPRTNRGQAMSGVDDKKEPPLPAAQSDNREASNRVDRSHSVSKTLDALSNKGESLTKS